MDALRSVKELLKRVPTKTDNGVAIFVGGGVSELVFPPQPLKRPLYKCGKGFELGPLLTMLKDQDPTTIGVVLIDGQSCVFATARGGLLHHDAEAEEPAEVKVLHTLTTHNRGRCRRGGQSALRFDRIRDQVEHAFVTEAAEIASRLFLVRATGGDEEYGNQNSDGHSGNSSNAAGAGSGEGTEVLGLLLAGPANVKHLLAESVALAQPLAAKLIACVDTSQGGRAAIPEALRKSADCIRNILYAPESAVLDDFFGRLERDDTQRMTYGVRETLAALEAHAVKTVIASRDVAEATPYPYHAGTSAQDGEGGTACAAAEEEESVSLAEFLQGPDGVAKSNAELVWIHVRSEDGVRFAEGFGGLGAFLHWEFEVIYDDEPGANEAELFAEEAVTTTHQASADTSHTKDVPSSTVTKSTNAKLRANAPVWSP